MRRRQPHTPERRALTSVDLRAIWTRAPSPEARELLWEIHRLHGVLLGCQADMEIIRAAWQEDVGGRLAAIEWLRARLREEPCVAEANVDRMRSTRES
ncbi:hypothetical protein [Pandoraea commovens]|uniref:Uncharacterized protein n=1 Tax=Pandoraea commovens TaxID=2508289 RepID=A0ABY5QI92_9BURK|nr:hypothetical protein [Pandoraea commovens]UVA80526.1 hypothetical protein NTU39_05760 [Pandoraea commovens]